MPAHRDVVKSRVGPALYQVMEPGDQIMAGTLAITGPSTAWDLLPVLPGLAGSAAGAAGLFSSFSFPDVAAAGLGVVPYLLALPLQFWRRPVFVAVTQRQLICYRMSRLGNEPSRLLFCAPLAGVRMTSLSGGMPPWRSVRYSGPGADGRSLRFNVRGRWREDLNEVLTTLQAGGAAVDGLPLGRPALQLGFLASTQTLP